MASPKWYYCKTVECTAHGCTSVSWAFFQAAIADAHKDVLDVHAYGGTESNIARMVKREVTIRAANRGKSVAYLREVFRAGFVMTAQYKDADPAHWYAGVVTHAPLNPSVVRALARIVRDGTTENPLAVVGALKATEAYYLPGACAYVLTPPEGQP